MKGEIVRNASKDFDSSVDRLASASETLAKENDRLRADNARLVRECQSIMTRFRELVKTNEKHYNSLIDHQSALKEAKAALESCRRHVMAASDMSGHNLERALTTINKVLSDTP